MAKAEAITKSFGLFYLFSILLAINPNIMKPEDKKHKSEKEEQKSLSITLLSAYGAIFTAAGIFGDSELFSVIRNLYIHHKLLILIGAILFVFSFPFLIVSLSIVEKDMKGTTEFARNKKLIGRKLFYNKMSVCFFFLASTIFILLFIADYG